MDKIELAISRDVRIDILSCIFTNFHSLSSVPKQKLFQLISNYHLRYILQHPA